MLGFFIVRRMLELHKVSSATRNHDMKVFSSPARGKLVTMINHHRIEELYDFDRQKIESKRPFYISNQFIHAYTSYVARDGSRNWSDIFVVSDFDRNMCIWRVPISEIRRVFAIASQDYPHSLSHEFDPKKGDYVVTTN